MESLFGYLSSFFYDPETECFKEFPIEMEAFNSPAEVVRFSRYSKEPPLSPSEINTEKSLEVLKESIWSSSPKVLMHIGTDYGRSLYFFVGGLPTPVHNVHKYGFQNYGTVTPEECVLFFQSMGYHGDYEKIKDTFQSSCPLRSNLITRIKYESLRRYLEENGKPEDQAKRLALIGMACTTQHTLAYIKHKILERLPKPLASTQFRFFHINFQLEPTNTQETQQPQQINIESPSPPQPPPSPKLHFQLKLTNYAPKSGHWQTSSSAKPTEERHAILANFAINLEDPQDKGIIRVLLDGNDDQLPYKERIHGIFDGDQKVVIPFRDTSPTW